MLTPIPVEELVRKLSPVNYRRDVYVFVFRNEQWDILRADTDQMSQMDTFSCFAAPEITGRNEYLMGFERMGNRAFPEFDMVFAVTYGEEETKALMAKMIAIENTYLDDMRGPLLKMHTAMAVLQASLDD